TIESSIAPVQPSPVLSGHVQSAPLRPARGPSDAPANRAASEPPSEAPAETSSSTQTAQTAPASPGNSSPAVVPTNGDSVAPTALALKDTSPPGRDSGVAPPLTRPGPNSFNRPLPTTDLDRLILEIWDDEQLLFPDTIPQVDDVLFPDAVPTPDDMPSPG